MNVAAAKHRLYALAERARASVDISSLAAFRVLFGLMTCFGTLRFMYYGWVDQFFVKPDFFFHYWGFEWVQVLPPTWMHAAFIALAALSFLVAIGLFYRVAIVGFFLLFSYVELLDVANYLNHYYLVSLIAFLLCFLPANAAWSVDTRLFPKFRRQTVPAFYLWLLRFQVGTVYFFAGVAKIGTDWLVHAQPLNIWLSSRVDTPIIGPYLDLWWIALAMGWAGLLNDLLMPFLLSFKKSRPLAYACVVVFHLATGYFFRIGMFPLIMIVSATIFFGPSWPRRFVPRRSGAGNLAGPDRPSRWQNVAMGLALSYCLIQVLVPLRSLAYPGNVLWSEQGMRWSWRVMVREKNGSITYRVKVPGREREYHVSPSRYLTSHQEREMSGQPDLILQLAHHIGEEFRQKGHDDVEVYADALVSLNGRAPKTMIDPTVDLMKVDDGLARADWILPGPTGAPPRLERLSGEYARTQ